MVTLIALITLLSLVPCFFAYLLYSKRDRLKLEQTKMEIGNLYTNFKTNGIDSLSYPIVFMIRRTLFAALTFTILSQIEV